MKTTYKFLILLYLLLKHFLSIGQITGTFTADNSYAVYVGNQNSVVTKVLPNSNANGHTNALASEIFNPTQNNFNATSGDYLYLIAWSDDKTCQGLIGEFTGSTTIKTGDPGWKGYPTNQDFDNYQAPTAATINQHINTANANSAWLNPFVGPKNINSKNACGSYRKVKGISDDAKWIWHNATSSNSAKDVFGKSKNHKEFLIFRFPVRRIVDPKPIDDCDCIPEETYSLHLTGDAFEIKDVTGNFLNFTYKLRFKPNLQIASLSTAWNGWINALFSLSGGQQCLVVHQYMLYEYTSNSPGTIQTETFLEQFWSTPNYLSNPGNNFNTTLQSNKKYYIKHGVYYGRKDGGKCKLAKDCPWKDTKLFINTYTGDTPKVRITDEKGNIRKELPTKLKSKRF